MKQVIPLIFILFSFGCVTYKSLNEDLALSTPAITKFQEMSFEKLSTNKPVLRILGESGESFEFESGKSFYLAFELPTGSDSFFEVRSHFSSIAGKFADIVYPTLITLDSNFEILRKIEEEFEHKTNPWGINPATSYFPIQYHPEGNEKYLVIYADPKYVGSFGDWVYEFYSGPPLHLLQLAKTAINKSNSFRVA